MGSYKDLVIYYNHNKISFFDIKNQITQFVNNLHTAVIKDLETNNEIVKLGKFQGETISAERNYWKFSILILVGEEIPIQNNDTVVFVIHIRRVNNNSFEVKIASKGFTITDNDYNLNPVVEEINRVLYEIYKSNNTYYPSDGTGEIREIHPQ